MQELKPGALTGVNVVDLSRLLPGPYCSMILADHGARVIAVEDKRFLADGLFFNLINRNKEHMSLNLKTEKGKEIFFRLAQNSDVCWKASGPVSLTDWELATKRFAKSIRKLSTVRLPGTVRTDRFATVSVMMQII